MASLGPAGIGIVVIALLLLWNGVKVVREYQRLVVFRLGRSFDAVLVHDAARPLTSAGVFRRALEQLERSGADAVVVAAPLADTVKEVAEDGRLVRRTLDRAHLWAAQTPQVFRRETLQRVLEGASEETLAAATDDAWLVERAGGVVQVLPCKEPNFKITTPTDLRLAEVLLAERAAGGGPA